MGRSYVRLLTIVLAGSGLAPLITLLASRYEQDRVFPWSQLPLYSLIALCIIALAVLLHRMLTRLTGSFERAASDQAVFLMNELPERWIGVAIVASAALRLFLELAIIRWQATVFPFFSFYKNLSLLSCFAGLGLGYSLGRRDRVPLFLTMPLLCWQFLFMIGMRYGMSDAHLHSLYVLPFTEQLNMGLNRPSHFYHGSQTYFLLAVVFLLTALAFIPIGQLCGCLLERRKKLTGYGFNLLGSLAGVLLMFVVSAFSTPPSIWFLIAFALLFCFYVRKQSVVAIGAASAVLALAVLEWPVSPELQRIYSPYQLLEVGRNDRGLMEVRAAGHYYQRVYDFLNSPDALPANSPLRRVRDYYDLPYQIVKQPQDVAVVGAERVDAIEIDRDILMLGRNGHPEHPYSNPRVHAVVNDARSFLRTTDRTMT